MAVPDSTSETVLKALFAALGAAMPIGTTLVRNESIPTRISAEGWVCLRDGDPGEPEVLLSPATYIYEHLAEVDVVIELRGSDARDALFDRLKQAVGSAIAADRTLGGLCDYVLGRAPEAAEVPVEGGENLKAATIGIILTYGSSDPLA